MTSPKFQELYKKLNKEQREAVDAIEGPVMVVAGPGTGKTTVLTLRIANILAKTDTAPDSILALTFTDSGVSAMRRKLVEIIGAATYHVHIHTFHSFANEIIKLYSQEFPRIIGAQHMTDVDQLKIMENIISETKLKKLKSVMNEFYYLKPILAQIRNLKREDIDSYRFEELARAELKVFEATPDLYYESGKYKGEIKGKYKAMEKRIENNLELAVIYKKYQDALETEHLYDYEDMIMEVARVLKTNKDLLLQIQEEYQYVLADEHQDANNAQNNLLELISGFHANPNLFIVGDEKQAIFRFQGASLENFLYFKKKYPSAKSITLRENYRSHQTLIDAAHGLGHAGGGTVNERIRLESRRTHGEKIRLCELLDINSETSFVAGDVAARIKAGARPESIAVFYRNNKDALALEAAFEKEGVSVAIHSDHDLLTDEDIWKFLLLLRAAQASGEAPALAPALYIDFLKIDQFDIHKVINESYKKKIMLADLIRSKKLLKDISVVRPESFLKFAEDLAHWSTLARNKSLPKAVETIASESGFLSHIMSLPNSLDKLALYDAFLNNVKNIAERHKNARLKDLLVFLDTLSEHEVEIKQENSRAVRGAVNLMTAHKSKGLEFDVVYIVHATDRVWGGGRRHSKYFSIPGMEKLDVDSDLDDERRLFYVALTRAREEAVVSWNKLGDGGKEELPTRFIEEIDSQFVSEVERPALPKPTRAKTLATAKSGVGLMNNRSYLRELFLEQGFNVSALNNYLECPWRYFFLNLIRIPKTEEKPQLYGTAVHESLKEFFDAYHEGNDFGKKKLLELFESHLSRKYLDERDYEGLLAKGREALGGYYDFYRGQWNKEFLTEFKIGGVFLSIQVGEEKINLLLTGKLDKVESLNGDEVNVVDYKTGRPKTRNEILGKTKSSDGNYFRQLVFYKILLDLFKDGKYKMTSGEIDFIEPATRGKYKKEKFEVAEAHTEELKKEIGRVAGEILSFSFFDKTCGEKDCEYCRLGKLVS